MLSGMSSIEIIENRKIEKLTENRVIRRFGWLPTIYLDIHHVHCKEDDSILQQDLHTLADWSSKWLMEFNI